MFVPQYHWKIAISRQSCNYNSTNLNGYKSHDTWATISRQSCKHDFTDSKSSMSQKTWTMTVQSLPRVRAQHPAISRPSSKYNSHQPKELYILENLNNEYVVSFPVLLTKGHFKTIFWVALHCLEEPCTRRHQNNNAEPLQQVSPLSCLPFQDISQLQFYHLKELCVQRDLNGHSMTIFWVEITWIEELCLGRSQKLL